MNETISEAIDMVLEFMHALTTIVAILDPAEDGLLDEYCTGYVYGLEGSKVMVTLANRFVTPVNKDGKAAKLSEFSPGEALKGVIDGVEKGMADIANEVVGTISNLTAGAPNDEL